MSLVVSRDLFFLNCSLGKVSFIIGYYVYDIVLEISVSVMLGCFNCLFFFKKEKLE